MLEPDRRSVSAPSVSVVPPAGASLGQVQIHIRARDEYRSLGLQLAREESVAEEMTLSCLPVEQVNPA
jgi:hypothetical protein